MGRAGSGRGVPEPPRLSSGSPGAEHPCILRGEKGAGQRGAPPARRAQPGKTRDSGGRAWEAPSEAPSGPHIEHRN
eukprot:330997-Alexandrium_andersonii.AAC.1